MGARLEPTARRVTVQARAKINLFLAVGPRRPDGFHDLATVFQSVDLADTLVVEPRRRGFTLVVRHEDASLVRRLPGSPVQPPRRPVASVPRGAANLVLRAARRVAAHTGIDGGARFTLIKRIPARAGLGGGSSDAAAVIIALPSLYGVRIGREEKLAIAAEIGSDVPFAIVGGTALGFGRGERLTPIRMVRPFRALIAVPSWRVSTAEAFTRIDRRKYALTAWRAKLKSAQSLGRKQLSAAHLMRLGNVFEHVLENRRSEFISLCSRLRETGVTGTRMTGTGSAVFGILPPGRSAKEVVDRFVGKEKLYVARSAPVGLRINRLP